MAAIVKGVEGGEEKRVYKWRGTEDIRDGAKHYNSLSINDATYSIGDCVYVCCGEDEDSICQIMSLFENLYTNDKEMTVRWFIRDYELPVYLKPYQDKVPNLAKGEVIFIDKTTLLSVECIIRKAEVLSCTCASKGAVFCQWAISTANGLKIELFKLVKPVFKPVSGSRTTGSCLSSSTGRISSRKSLRPRTSAAPITQRDRKSSTPNKIRTGTTSSTNLRPGNLKRKAWTSPRKPSLSLRSSKGDEERRVLFHDTALSSLEGTKRTSELKNRKRVLSPIQEEGGGDKNDSFKSRRRKLDLSDIHTMLNDDDDSYKENAFDDDDDIEMELECEERESENVESSLLDIEPVNDDSFEEPLPKRKPGRPPKSIKTPSKHSSEIVTPLSRKRGRPRKKIDTPSSDSPKNIVTPRKRGRPRKETVTPSSDSPKNIVTPRKRGRPRKETVTPSSDSPKNIVTPRKRGRPRKETVTPSSDSPKNIVTPRKRGRPRKEMTTPSSDSPKNIVTPRKRGRPRKETVTPSSDSPKNIVTTRKRGRPRKEMTTPSSVDSPKNIVTPLSRKHGQPPKVLSTSSSNNKAVTTPIHGCYDDVATPTSARRPPPVKCLTTPSRMRREGGVVIPVRPGSASAVRGRKKEFEMARVRLHVSSVPDSITCREREFTSICTFIESKLIQRNGGCIYISGVPGTGKTATVYEVSRHLIKKSSKDRKLPHFKFIEINGLKLTEPKQAYVSILKQLTGEKASASKAADSLDTYFSTRNKQRPPIVLLADELDMLWNKKQSVLYNLFDWPTRPNSRLIVLAVANTMDLPERVMSSRVSSRLGLTRLTFNPYTFNDLRQIVTNRMVGLKVFEPDAVLLASRKVAAVTGDARRALDICRRATEIAEEEGKSLVGMMEVSSAIQELFSSPMIMAVKHATFNQRFFLQALIAEFRSTGLEETILKQAISRMNSILTSQDNEPLSYPEILSVATTLGSMRVILFESSKSDLYRKIRLNMSQDDIEFGLKNALPLTY